jgi:hypothetical protein
MRERERERERERFSGLRENRWERENKREGVELFLTMVKKHDR